MSVGGIKKEHRPATASVPRCAAGHDRGPAKGEREGSSKCQGEVLGPKARVWKPSTPRHYHRHRSRVSPGAGDHLCAVVE